MPKLWILIDEVENGFLINAGVKPKDGVSRERDYVAENEKSLLDLVSKLWRQHKQVNMRDKAAHE